MRIGFAGTPAPAVETLTALLATHHQIDIVVTRPDAPVGRGKVMTPSPVAALAESEGLRTVKRDSLRDCAELFADLDLVVVVAFGALVPQDLLEVPRHGWVNVHYSLLPRWRGAAPVQYSILAGDKVAGVSVFQLEAGLDTGPVYQSESIALTGTETSGTLMEELTHIGCRTLITTLANIESGNAVAVPQDRSGVTYASKIATSDARIDWRAPAHQVDQLIRAMTPHPGAWTMHGEERIKVSPVTLHARHDLAPGQCVREDGCVVVGTGSGAIALTQVQRAGRTMVDAVAWFTPDTLLS